MDEGIHLYGCIKLKIKIDKKKSKKIAMSFWKIKQTSMINLKHIFFSFYQADSAFSRKFSRTMFKLR